MLVVKIVKSFEGIPIPGTFAISISKMWMNIITVNVIRMKRNRFKGGVEDGRGI